MALHTLADQEGFLHGQFLCLLYCVAGRLFCVPLGTSCQGEGEQHSGYHQGLHIQFQEYPHHGLVTFGGCSATYKQKCIAIRLIAS